MTARRAAVLVAGAAALALAACGAMQGDGDDDPVDGGAGDADICGVGVTWTPFDPVAGETITLAAFVPEATGFLTYAWTVSHAGQDVALTQVTADSSAVAFVAENAGPHFVDLYVGGTPCRPYFGAINVRAPGATDTPWRLRFTPPPGTVPPQERVIYVPSGADWEVPEVALDPGATISGHVRDPDGAGVAAYLRLVPAGTPDLAIDGFAGAGGAFSVNVTLTRHHLLVIPFRADLPPRLLRDWMPAPGPLVVDTGAAVSGVVLDPDDQPLAGATVTLRVAGVPSTVATTGPGGAFTVRARPAAGAAVEVVVAPPAGAGLPRLASAPAILDLGAPLSVRYGASLIRRDVAGAAVALGGAAVAGGQVTFAGTIGAAGRVDDGATQAIAAGTFAIAVPVDGGGALASARVPAGPAAAVVAAGGARGVVAVDLTAGVPATIAAPGAAAVTARIADDAGAPVPGAEVRATPAGALALAGAAEVLATADAAGQVALPLAGGGRYELVIVDRRGERALLRAPIEAAVTGSLGDLALPDGMALTGMVSAGATMYVGGAVTVFCESCEGPPRARPAAEAWLSGSGRYRATLLDPGLPSP